MKKKIRIITIILLFFACCCVASSENYFYKTIALCSFKGDFPEKMIQIIEGTVVRSDKSLHNINERSNVNVILKVRDYYKKSFCFYRKGIIRRTFLQVTEEHELFEKAIDGPYYEKPPVALTHKIRTNWKPDKKQSFLNTTKLKKILFRSRNNKAGEKISTFEWLKAKIDKGNKPEKFGIPNKLIKISGIVGSAKTLRFGGEFKPVSTYREYKGFKLVSGKFNGSHNIIPVILTNSTMTSNYFVAIHNTSDWEYSRCFVDGLQGRSVGIIGRIKYIFVERKYSGWFSQKVVKNRLNIFVMIDVKDWKDFTK